MVLSEERGGHANGKEGSQRGADLRALHQGESGERVADICREHRVSEATFYVWKKKYSGLALNELRELRQLREENGRRLSGCRSRLQRCGPANQRERSRATR
jgi:transposase-like protein